MPYLKNIRIRGRKMEFPIYFPDATRAVVKSLDSRDIKEAGIEGVVVNTYHLSEDPGSAVLKSFGGIAKYMNWEGFVSSDSGGFQLFSLIHRNKSLGKITDEGILFGEKKRTIFTPEDSIKLQFGLNSDIMVCLDDFTPPEASKERVRESVSRTTLWAGRCKEEYERQIKRKGLSEKSRPLLFAVIQGGWDLKERKRSAEELIDIGFDGFGFGGWPINDSGKLDLGLAGFVSSVIPEQYPKFALGVGFPNEIAKCVKLGWNIFDCVLPTRDARHKRLYCFRKDWRKTNVLDEDNLIGTVHISKERFYKDTSPISAYCDCFTCRNYSKAYLYHLFKMNEFTAGRLATIHNLRTYSILIGELRKVV